MDVFLFSLFIYLCAEYALQWEEQALVSALTKTRLQAGVSLWHGHRHHLAGCWLLWGSLCVVRRALQGKSGPVLFGHLLIFSCFTLWADRLSFPAGLVLYMCLFWNEPILSLWKCCLSASWSPCISGSFQPCSLGSPPGPAAWLRLWGLGSLPPAEVLRFCSPEIFPSCVGPLLWSLLLFRCGIKISVGVLLIFFLLFLYLKFQSSRSRTVLVPAAFSFSSHSSFNFTLFPALCLQAICVLWTLKKLCQKEAFLSSPPPIVEPLLDNCN